MLIDGPIQDTSAADIFETEDVTYTAGTKVSLIENSLEEMV
jgi:hypothetical protein